MVREFKLINEKGQEYSLMDIKKYCLLTEPTGLGYSYETEYEQLGNTFVTNLRKIGQGQIEGTVNFKKYDNYKKLVDFIEQSESLKFSYKVPIDGVQKEYYKDVQIQSITKTQLQPNRILSESIIFDSLSLWYEKNDTIFNIEPLDNEIRWDFEWDSVFTDYNGRSLPFINKGHTESSIEVEMQGELINPEIDLYINGDQYQSIVFNTTIQNGEKLLYSSKENDFYILKEDQEGNRTNLFDLNIIDFGNDNVIRIPKNKSCELKLKAQNDVLNAKITIYSYYKSV